ncbi:phenoloxidase-activating enzyme-like isoform X1 [Aricia agestis]|uniref:phenoloxidase-activating enzyme-like isoform X1 n=1 Tax=Aricia agestis TaxID=91739 RepID=UPI001C201A21|nr:phenoloxidase-activating enzyme-like isoform X1 [Aricia agestis]
MKSVLFGVVCTLLRLCVLDAQEICKTPTDLDGKCIPIDDCEKLKPLVKESAEQREYLKQWTCGFVDETPMVCCPNKASHERCVTFSGQPGTCKPLESCPFLRKKLETIPVSAANLEYVQRSRCDRSRENYFCCDEADLRHGNEKNESLLPDRSAKRCGVHNNSKNRIIAGKATAIDAYPWMGIIEYADSGRPYLCAGSLINDRYVLTAAHCLVSSNNRSLGAGSVRFGEYNVTNEGPDCVETEGGGIDCTTGVLSIKIESFIVHPEYDKSKTLKSVNDIALIRLMEPTPYTEFIRPVCLPGKDITAEPPSNLTLVIAGWGYKNETHYSDVKLDAIIPLADRDTCLKKYSRDGIPTIGPSQICAGGGEKDVCGGDSGGPLSYYHQNDNFEEIVGVISFGPRQCATIDRPSVYTKVYDYLDWIKSNIKA